MADPAVGDVNSDARGSGARFNAGKVPYNLLPLAILVERVGYCRRDWAFWVLKRLGEWQAGDDHALDVACETAARSAGSGLRGYAEAARVFEHGQRKYSAWNWAKGMQWSVPLGCAVRHLIALLEGETTDPESGLHHRGHVLCNLLMLLSYRHTFQEGDDRPVKFLKLPGR